MNTSNNILLYKRTFVIGLFVSIIVILYFKTFIWLASVWMNNKAYSHGFLVPLVSAYIFWNRRRYFFNISENPSPIWGGLLICISGILLIAGRVGGLVIAEAISFVIIIPGFILQIWGRKHLVSVSLPLLYLQFMIPWVNEIIERVHWPFQIVSAKIGVWILEATGYPIYLEGQFIQLPKITLEVAKECSGVLFLTSVITLGIPLVYMTQRSWRRGIVVISSGVLITILANGVRVALSGVMAMHYGPRFIHGTSHTFQGWFVAQVGFISLFFINWVIYKIPSNSNTTLEKQWKYYSTPLSCTHEKHDDTKRLFNALLLIIGIGIYMHLFAATRPVPPLRSLNAFPQAVGEWNGVTSEWLQGQRFYPEVDSEVIRTYRNSLGKEIHLYIGYYETQRQGKALINYLAGPLHENAQEINMDHVIKIGASSGFTSNVNLSKFSVGKYQYATLFWYRFPSGEVSGRYHTKLKSLMDAMLERRNNGAVILIAMPIYDRNPEPSVISDLQSFAAAITPELRNYIP